MRILYGLCGEGKGHATRSVVAIRHLVARGHEILAAASGQAFPLIRDAAIVENVRLAGGAAFEREPSGCPRDERRTVGAVDEERAPRHRRGTWETIQISGLSMTCREGALDLGASVAENLRRLPETIERNAEAWREATAFAPQAVVTDFDSFAWLFGRANDLPIVSIDNAQILPRCVHAEHVTARHADGIQALDAFTRSKTPEASRYIVTSFFFPPLRPECVGSTTLVPPVLRESVLKKLRSHQSSAGAKDRRPTADDLSRVLVYKTASLDDASLLAALGAVDARFVVYGCSESAELPVNCFRRPFSEDGFIRDLAACSAVVGNGGMSLLGEALAFGKPVLAVPVRGQYEQILNAEYLTYLRYGMYVETLRAPELAFFLKRAPIFADNIQLRPQHDENRRLYGALDGLFGRG